MSTDCDVLIAGAGPAGLVAALVLARAGAKVIVLEAAEAFPADGRASTFHPPTLEMLEHLGVADRLIAIGLKAPTFQYRRRADESLIAEFDLSLLSKETAYPYRLQCEQSLLTPLLADALAPAGGDLRFGTSVTAVEPSDDSVSVSVRRADDTTSQLSGKWLIGADGSHSVVRRSLGIPFEGKTVPELFLVMETDVDMRDRIPGISYVNYVVDPERWYVVLRTQAVWRILTPLPEGEQAFEGHDLADIAARELAGLGDWAVDLPLRGQSVYRVHQRVADSFAEGRCLIIGDAAHLNNPLGGMGMNAAIHDAWFLGHVLAKVLRAEEPESAVGDLLASRRAMFIRHVQNLSEGNWERLRERDDERREANAAHLRAISKDVAAATAYLRSSSLLAAAREAGLAPA